MINFLGASGMTLAALTNYHCGNGGVGVDSSTYCSGNAQTTPVTANREVRSHCTIGCREVDPGVSWRVCVCV